MGKWHKSTYDDGALVEAIARGGRPYTRIAEELGMPRDYVGQIARGQARYDLWPKIKAARLRVIEQDRRRGRMLAQRAVARLAKIIAPDSKAPPDVQCRACMDILHMAVGDYDPARRRWRGRRGPNRRNREQRNREPKTRVNLPAR